MEHPMDNPFKSLMNPRSIAITGASNNPMKMGTMHALSILKDGFDGKLYPVHPKEKEILGLPAYQDVEDIPETPELAIFVVPAAAVPGLLEAFGKKGTRRAIIITAGFREVGDDGKDLEEKINSIADKYNIRFIGPNCMGVINTEISLNTTVASLTEKPGYLGFISQSGTYVTQSLPYLRKHGIRFSKAISVGNEANMSIIDALEYLGEDQQTRAIALYIEGIRDIPRFLEVARRITPHKPVIAQYVGGSQAGARSGLSHTGALAGPAHLYEGLFRQAGVLQMHSVEDLYGHGWTLATQPKLRGNRLGVLTNSGGPGTAMANTCEMGGFDVPPFSPSLQEKIKPLIPPHAPSGNPVDITFNLNLDVLATEIPRLVMESGEVDAIVLHGAFRYGFIEAIYPHIRELVNNAPIEDILSMMPSDFDSPGKLPHSYGIPMTISSFFDSDDDFTRMYHENDIPHFDAPEKTARAMVSMLQYRQVAMREPYIKPELPATEPEASSILASALEQNRQALDEHEAKKILKLYGIPVPDEIIVHSEDDAVHHAEGAGFPVVMKALHHDIMHKTEKGLIGLNISSGDEVRQTYRLLQERAGMDVPVLLCHMVEGSREFMAGTICQQGFGPAVLFGLGGIFTEGLRDTSFRAAPLSLTEAREMLNDIRGHRLLGEFRNMPAVDMDALALVLQQLSFIPLLHPEITEIDCNPIIIEGSRPVAVDALIVLGNNSK